MQVKIEEVPGGDAAWEVSCGLQHGLTSWLAKAKHTFWKG